MSSRALALVAIALTGASCGGTSRPTDAANDQIILPDGSAPDATDGESGDAGDAEDASDAGDATDASDAPDADDDANIIPPSCTYDVIDTYELARSPIASAREVSVAPLTAGFGVVWADESHLSVPNVHGCLVPTSEDPGEMVSITEGSTTATAPTMVARGSTFLIAWQDNRVDSYEIYARVLASDLTPTGSEERLTANALLDERPVMLLVTGGALVAWTQWDEKLTEREAHAVRLSATGAVSGPERVPIEASDGPASIDLGALAETHAVLWVKGDDTGADVMMQRLDDDGAPVDDIDTLSTEHNADGSLDAALIGLEGAVVFGASVEGRHEVRIVILDSVGIPVAEEMAVTVAPIEAQDPSVSPFSEGYVVGYRVVAGEDDPLVRLAFVTARGIVLETRDLAVAAQAGGRTTTAVGPDGTILVAWADIDGSETIIRASRIRCSE